MRLVRWVMACAALLILASPAAADPAGSATGGNAGSQSWLAGCVYNTVPPTLVSGQQVALQCNANGNLTFTVTTPTPTTINAPFHQTVTTAAVALTTQTFVNGIVMTALPTNVSPICIGTSAVTTATGYCIGSSGYPQSISYAVSTTANIYIIGSNSTDAIQVTGN